MDSHDLLGNLLAGILIAAPIVSTVHHFLPSTQAKRAAEHKASVEQSRLVIEQIMARRAARIAFCESRSGEWIRKECLNEYKDEE